MASMRQLLTAMMEDWDDEFQYEESSDWLEEWVTMFEENEV